MARVIGHYEIRYDRDTQDYRVVDLETGEDELYPDYVMAVAAAKDHMAEEAEVERRQAERRAYGLHQRDYLLSLAWQRPSSQSLVDEVIQGAMERELQVETTATKEVRA